MCCSAEHQCCREAVGVVLLWGGGEEPGHPVAVQLGSISSTMIEAELLPRATPLMSLFILAMQFRLAMRFSGPATRKTR